MKGVEHLKDALGRVFADVDAAAKYFAGGIENDKLHFGALAREGDSVRESRAETLH